MNAASIDLTMTGSVTGVGIGEDLVRRSSPSAGARIPGLVERTIFDHRRSEWKKGYARLTQIGVDMSDELVTARLARTVDKS